MRGGTVFILVHGDKSQGQLWHFVYKTLLERCKLLMKTGGTLLILGHGVKGQDQHWHSLYKALWAHYTTVYTCPITFKLLMQIIDDNGRNPIDRGHV